MFGGTRLTTATRSPPTASVRLRRSVVVVTTWMRSCANPGVTQSVVQSAAQANHAATRAKRNASAVDLTFVSVFTAGPSYERQIQNRTRFIFLLVSLGSDIRKRASRKLIKMSEPGH